MTAALAAVNAEDFMIGAPAAPTALGIISSSKSTSTVAITLTNSGIGGSPFGSAMITVMLCGSQDCQLREISPIARNITREQRQPFDGRMRSDVKGRKRCGPLAAPSAIAQEALASEEAGFPRQSFPFVGSQGQRGIQSFNGAKTDRHLGVDNRIDDQGRTVGTLSQRASRPVGPSRVVGSIGRRNCPRLLASIAV